MSAKESYLIETDTDTALIFLRDEILSVYDDAIFWDGATLSRTCEDTLRSQQAHDVIMTSYQRRCDVMTGYRRTGEPVPSKYWAEG